MAKKRITELATETTLKDGQYVAIDHTTDGTKKLNIGAELTDLKEDLNLVVDNLLGAETQIDRTSNNYCPIETLTYGKTYRIGISVATAGNYGVKVSTAGTASAVVATLFADNTPFNEDEIKYIIYTPVGEGEKYIRLSSNTVSWSVYVSEVTVTNKLVSDINDINTDVSGIHAYVDNKFELAGETIQMFDSGNYLKEDDIYCQATGNLISYAGCIILTTEVNARQGDTFVWQFFNDVQYGTTIIGLQCFTTDDIPVVGGVTIDVGGTIDTNNKRGFLTLSDSAKYLNVMVRFDTEENKTLYQDQMKDTFLLKYGTAYSDSYTGFYLTVVQSVEKRNVDNYWAGKNIWWCGTSIPAGVDVAIGSEGNGLTYPELVGQYLNATVINKSLGSSMARANVRTGDYVDVVSHNIIYALSQTTEEKQYLIDNWATIKQVIHDPNTYESLSAISANVLGASFESRLMPYLDGTYEMPDLFVFDHGHNDWKTIYTMPDGTTPDTELQPTASNISNDILAEDTYMTDNNNAKLISFFGEISSIPSAKRSEFVASVNRNCFIGAVNFLVTLILSKNPRARIVFIGNLDNWEKPQVQPAQEALANSWEFPLIRVWEHTGFSDHYIPNTSTFWNASGTTDLTMKQIYCKDSVHPHSDTTGETIPMYARIIANALKNIV